MKLLKRVGTVATAMALVLSAATARAESIPVGNLATLTGPTSPVASVYAQGIIDSVAYINAKGGIGGSSIDLMTKDYGYDATRAVAIYKDWLANHKPVVIQGWGTPDTEALVSSVAKDGIVFMSGSSSGHLTDPTGRSPHTNTPAPYNFFYGPSYSDGCRGLMQWASEDWKRSGAAGQSTFLQDLYRPKLVYVGDNAAYPNAPKAACLEFARDLGFDIMPAIRVPLTPGDFTAQCETLKQSGANYAFLANTSDSNVALVKACAKIGTATQFLTNIYGWDESAAMAAGDAGNGVVWVVTAALWTDQVPGMALVREISKMSDPSGTEYRPSHYMRGVCSAFLMRDAMEGAAKAGAVTGPNIKTAFEGMRAHVPAGLEGVCLPETWTAEDHRGSSTVNLYRSSFNYGKVAADKIYSTQIPLRPDWLGW